MALGAEPEPAVSARRGSRWWPDLSVGLLACVIVLVPYGTVTMSRRGGLYVQAAALLAVCLVALLVGVARGGLGRFGRAARRPFFVGAGLYGAAALLAGVVGLASGNAPDLIAGQLLSMGLLPLGAAAGLVLGGGWRGLRAGLVGATAAVCLAHLTSWFWAAAHWVFVPRLYFSHYAVGAAGFSLLALLLALSASGRERAGGRLAVAAGLIITFYIAGSGTRSLWVAAVLGVAVYSATAGITWRMLRRMAFAGALALAVLALAGFSATAWWRLERPNLAPPLRDWLTASADGPAGSGGRHVVAEEAGWVHSRGRPPGWLSAPLPVGSGSFRVRAELKSEADGPGGLRLLWLDGGEKVLVSTKLWIGPGRGWVSLESAACVPPGVRTVRLMTLSGDGVAGRWWLRALSIERVSASPLPALVYREIDFTGKRVDAALGTAARGVAPDPSVDLRVHESARLTALFREASPWRKVFGRGLGAVFQLRTEGAPGAETNYIHNFYLFLLFKTGVLGTVLVLAALAVWVLGTRRMFRDSHSASRKTFLRGVFAAWVAYLAWSAVCPEILDFRVAPLWGLVVAASFVETQGLGIGMRDEAEPTSKPSH